MSWLNGMITEQNALFKFVPEWRNFPPLCLKLHYGTNYGYGTNYTRLFELPVPKVLFGFGGSF